MLIYLFLNLSYFMVFTKKEREQKEKEISFYTARQSNACVVSSILAPLSLFVDISMTSQTGAGFARLGLQQTQEQNAINRKRVCEVIHR